MTASIKAEHVSNPWQGEILNPDRTYRMLIDGQFVEGGAGETLSCEYPYTGETWGSFPVATHEDVDRAVRAARRAYDEGWSSTSASYRASLLRKLSDLIDGDAKDISLLEIHQNGKVLSETSWEVPYTQMVAHYSAGLIEADYGHTVNSMIPDVVAYTVREPLGVVVAITPWNGPLGSLAQKLFPALAAGNTVVVKPSEVTPAETLWLGEKIMEAGFPAGVVNIVNGPGITVGRALVAHPLVDHVTFTGGTATGLEIAQICAGRAATYTLELGGKSPNIVFDSADLDRAVSGVMTGIFSASGQSCAAGSRILIQESISDEFFDTLATRINALRLGDPLDPATQISPVASRAQLAKVLSYIEIAQKEGATTLVGGGRATGPGLGDGFFVKPTIFTNVTNDSTVSRDEIFGPVGAVIRFKDEDDAVRIANDTRFGLAAGVWTENIALAHRMTRRLHTGIVWVNNYRLGELVMPWGGYGMTGGGREMGVEALRPYQGTKAIYIDLGNPLPF